MDTIGETSFWTFLPGASEPTSKARCSQVRRSAGFEVKNYLDLARRVAELQFRNRDYVLLFRGQNADHKNDKKNTSLKPTLFRSINNRNPDKTQLDSRFQALAEAERELAVEYESRDLLGRERLKRQRILRWAILQHYEICKTPLLDVSQSLRIAASFATHYAKDEAYVYVLGVPNISGAVTASAEAGLHIVRLASVCPPTADRPHLQEGYLLGEYPEMFNFDQKQHYPHFEIDFGRRLIAKFKFDPVKFWKGDSLGYANQDYLCPGKSDRFLAVADAVKKRIRQVA